MRNQWLRNIGRVAVVMILGLWVVPGYAQKGEQYAWITLVKEAEKDITAQKVKRLASGFVARYPKSAKEAVVSYLLGEHHFQAGQYQRAGSYFQALSEKKHLPFRPSALFRLGECYFNQKDVRRAQSVWAEILLQFPRSHLIPEVELNQCKRSLNRKKPVEAKKRLKNLLARYPFYRTHSEVVLAWARLAYTGQNHLEVLEQLSAVSTPEAVYLKGHSLLMLQKYFEIMTYFSQPHLTLEMADVLEHLVWALLGQKQYALALEASGKLLQAATARAGVRADMLLIRANCCYNLKQHTKALVHYREWLGLPRKDKESLYVSYLVGLTHYRLQQYTQAEKIWRQIAQEASAGAYGRALLFLIADAFYTEQAYVPAKKHYQKILSEYADDPEVAPAHLRLAQIYFKQSDDHKAMMAYIKFLRLSPQQKGNKRPAKMKEIMISDKNSLDASSEKFVCFYTRDIDRPMQETILQASALSRKQLPAGQMPEFETTPLFSNSNKVELPWLNLITWSPVMVIHPQNPKRDLKPWRFTVLDRNKTILYLREGNAPLPKKIAWDGKKRDGDRLGIGELFYYGMHLVDRSGQTLSTNSRPKKINSLAYIQNQDLYIHMLSELLFEDAEGFFFQSRAPLC